MTIHELKTWPPHFSATWGGPKTFELRRDDRGYETGDILHLREWSPETESYSGRELLARVTYLLRHPQFLPYCAMSIRIVEKAGGVEFHKPQSQETTDG